MSFSVQTGPFSSRRLAVRPRIMGFLLLGPPCLVSAVSAQRTSWRSRRRVRFFAAAVQHLLHQRSPL